MIASTNRYPCHHAELCFGCSACQQICPFDSIVMAEDDLGRTYAEIDLDKCRQCGMCETHCPVNHKINTHEIQSCYAAITKDDYIYDTTSSGGVATELSRFMINNGGIVYGAAFEDHSVQHIRVSSLNGLETLKGSKYVQSDINGQYRNVKDDLQQGKHVLFIGTPCQVAGLLSFLGELRDKLITVDLVCHGVPPMRYLQQHVTSLIGKQEISTITFRTKEFIISLLKDGKVIYRKDCGQDYYYSAFLDGLIFRSNCYACQFAANKRCSDITIGDFWNLEKSELKKKYKSVVLVNTDNGNLLWHQAMQNFDIEKRSIQEAINGNEQLRKPSRRPEQRDIFERHYSDGFWKALKRAGIFRKVRRKRLRGKLRLTLHRLGVYRK